MTVVVATLPPAAVVRHETSVVVTRQGGETAAVRQKAATSVAILRGVPGQRGLQGIPGPAGGAAIQRIAGAVLSALRLVYELDGAVYPLDWADADHMDLLLGITLTAADAGSTVNVQRSGVVDDAGWNWTPGRVYLGADGALTQTPPAGGFDVLIGVAVSATCLLLNIQDPIELE